MNASHPDVYDQLNVGQAYVETDNQFNLADVFEVVVDSVGERTALTCGDLELTYNEFEAMANKVAHFLADLGVKHNEHVSLYVMNSAEHFAALIGLLKIRAVPINVNYRYTGPELKHIFENSDSVAILVEEPEHQDTLASILDALPALRTVIHLGPATEKLSAAAAEHGKQLVAFEGYQEKSAERDFEPRSGDDHFVMYTGGTTGYPKGVVWRQHDFFMKPISGGNPYGESRHNLEEVGTGAAEFPVMKAINAAPLMHGAAVFSNFTFFCMGSHITMPRTFDAGEIVRLIESQGAQIVVIVGDGMGSPLADALEANTEHDISTLFSVSNGGAILSNGVRDRLLAVKPDLFLRDNFGASESGNDGEFSIDEQGKLRMPSSDTITVLGDDNAPLTPGSDQIGMIARMGNVPLGYYKDEAKTAKTFITLPDGRRASVLGDMGMLEADGSIVFLGRGSQCINTAGEKVFAEEVEAALHGHPAIADALVVGTPDARLGSKVSAVASLREGAEEPTLEELQTHCRQTLAGYKVPRAVQFVDWVRRTPAGKADYRWAKSQFEG